MIIEVQGIVQQGVEEHWARHNIDNRLKEAEDKLKNMFKHAEEALKSYSEVADKMKIEIQDKFTENENQSKELREFINKSNIANQGYTDNFRDMTAAELERIRKSSGEQLQQIGAKQFEISQMIHADLSGKPKKEVDEMMKGKEG